MFIFTITIIAYYVERIFSMHSAFSSITDYSVVGVNVRHI